MFADVQMDIFKPPILRPSDSKGEVGRVPGASGELDARPASATSETTDAA